MSQTPCLTKFRLLIMAGMVTGALLVTGINWAACQADEAAPKKHYAQEYYQSFRGKSDHRDFLAFTGPDSQEHVKYEPDGLRITLPLGYPDQRQGTGVALRTTVQGEFEATMSFEILKEPVPADTGKKYGTRVSLGIYLDTPEKKNEVAVTRRIDSRGTTPFVTYWYMANAAPDDSPKPRYRPTAAKTGRLRLVRAGTVVSCYVSEEADGEFVLLKEYPFSAQPLKSVYITTSTGGPLAALDVRVTDFRIRADAFPNMPAAALIAVPMSAPAPAFVPVELQPLAKSRPWLLAGLLLGGVLITFLGIGLGLWVVSRRRHAAGNPSVPTALKGEQTTPEMVAPPVGFRCSACGKKLKTAPGMVGQKIKCSACGNTVKAPNTPTDDAEEVS